MPEGAREKPAPGHREKATKPTTSDNPEALVSEAETPLLVGRPAPPDGAAAVPGTDNGGTAIMMAPSSASRSRVTLRLQRAVGNHAVTRTLERRSAEPAAHRPLSDVESSASIDGLAGLGDRAAEDLTQGFGGLELGQGPTQELEGLQGMVSTAVATSVDPGSIGPGVAGPKPSGARSTIQRFPELAAPLADPPIQAPEVPEISAPEPTGEVQSAVQAGEGQVKAAGQPPAGGGALDAVINQAKSWVTSKVSQASSIVGGVAGRLSSMFSGPLTSAFNFAKGIGSGIVSAIKSGATKLWDGIKSPLKSLQQGVAGVVRGVIQSASKAIKPLATKIGTMVRGLLGSGGDIVGSITGMITGAIAKIAAGLAALPARIVTGLQNGIAKISNGLQAIVSAAAAKLTQIVTRITTTVSSILSRAVDAVRSVLSRIEGFLRDIPSIIRSVIQPIVDTVLSTLRKVIDTITKAVTAALKKVSDTVLKIIETFRKKIDEKIAALTKTLVDLVKKFADLIKRGVEKAKAGIAAMIKTVKDTISAIVKRVTDPIKNLIANKLADWIAPKIKEALAQGGGLKKMLSDIPKRMAGAAKEVGKKAGEAVMITGHDVLRGLMRPDGDHFSVGISVGVTGEVGAGAGAAITGNADLVLDYASHEIGIFFTPGVTVGAGGGAQGEAGPKVDLTGTWGSVLSFGANRGAGVRQGYQGAFLGGAVSVDAELGARVSRSEGLYVGAAPVADAAQPLVDAAANGFNGGGGGGGGGTPPPPPPPPPPAPVVPPIPAPQGELPLGSQTVSFDTGKASLQAAGRAAIGNILDTTAHAHAGHPGATYRIGAVGGASLRWRHPGAQRADQLNQALSVQRAQVVAQEVDRGLGPRGLTGITQVQQDAIGSALGRTLGLPSDDNSAIFRATSVSAWERPASPPPPAPVPTPSGTGTGTGGGGGGAGGGGGGGGPAPAPGPGGPGSGPNTPSVKPGEFNWFGDDRKDKGIASAIPNPLHGPLVPDLLHRPTMGWDSGIGLGLRPGVGVGGEVSGSATFSIPIGAYGFPASAELPLRVASGLVKLTADIATMNLAGGLRDGVGIVGAFVPSAIVDGVASFVFPLPPGYTD